MSASIKSLLLFVLLPTFIFGQNFFRVFDHSTRDETASNLIVEDSMIYLINSNSYDSQILYKLDSNGEPLWSLELFEDEFNDAFTKEDTVLRFTAEELVYPENILRSALYSTQTGDFIRFEEDSVSIPPLEGTFGQTIPFYPRSLLKHDSLQYISIHRSAAQSGINQVGLLASRKDSEEVFSTTSCTGDLSPVVKFIGPNGLAYGCCYDEYGNPTYFNYDIESDSMSTMWRDYFNGPPPTWYVIPKIEFGSLSDRLYYTLSKKSYNRTLLVETKDLEGITLCSNIIEVLSSEHIVAHASAACANDDILVTGTHTIGSKKKELVWRFNKDCELLWEKELSFQSYDIAHQFTITAITEMSDGSILLAGSINDPFIENKRRDMFVMSVDADELLTETLCDTISLEHVFPEDSLLHSLVILNQPYNCPYDSTAQVQVFAKGGVPPYNYQIIGYDLQESATFDNLKSGDYQFRVVDALGQADTTLFSLTIEPLLRISDVLISGNDVDIRVVSNANPFEYSIDGGLTFSETNKFYDLEDGTYQIVARDRYGCTSEMVEISINFVVELSVEINQTPCFDSDNGEIILIGDGRYPPFTYQMDGVNLDQNVATDLSAAIYQFTVLDSLGNGDTIEYELDEYRDMNLEFEVDLDCISFPLNYAIDEISIDGGETFINYPWIGMKIPNLENGTYQVIAKDRYGCLSDIQEITIDIVLGLRVESEVRPCYESDNGQITLNAIGLYPPFTYQLDGETLDSNVITDLSAGLYHFSVRDSLGNEESVIHVLDGFPELTFTLEPNQNYLSINFPNSDIEEYSLDGGLTFSDLIYYETAFISNLQNGIYHIVCSGNGGHCLSDTVTVEIDFQLKINNSYINHVSCHGEQDGVINLIASGPNPPLLYQLNDGPTQESHIFGDLEGGQYTVSVMNATGEKQMRELTINEPDSIAFETIVEGDSISIVVQEGLEINKFSITNGETFTDSSTYTDLENGEYYIQLEDIGGCTSRIDTVVIFVPLKLDAVTKSLSCYGSAEGEIYLSVEGEFPPYQIVVNGVEYDNTYLFDNLNAGLHNITVIDSLNNEESIEVIISEPPPILFDVIVDDDQINILTDDSDQIYLYSVSGGLVFTPNSIFYNLPNGEYQVVVKDENGCLSETKPVVVDVTSSIDDESAFNSSIYPNPTTGIIKIDIAKHNHYPIKIEVLSPAGQIVFESQLKQQLNTHKLDLSHLPTGVYSLNMTDISGKTASSMLLHVIE